MIAVRKILGAVIGLMLLSHTASADTTPAGDAAAPPGTRQAAIWQQLFQISSASNGAPLHDAIAHATLTETTAAADQTQTPRPLAFEYSHAYMVRRKIHFYASFATIPLFVTQYVLGDKLFDDDDAGGSTKSAHSAAAVGIEALFGINSVTGVWNLWEARKDPNGRAKKLTHGLLMLGADVGFVATGLLAPEDGDRSGRNTHRNVAIGSMAVSTVSYLIMLIGR